MSRIGESFERIRSAGQGALIPFLTAGDPDPAATLAILDRIAPHSDVIELGVPFSDPLADGPVIQAASERALLAGTNLERVLEMAAHFRGRHQTPLVLMTYFNPVLQWGLARFATEAAQAGVDGLIISDLPPEEAEEWKAAADPAGLDTIFLLAPTSTDQRIKLVAERGSGFIYCVSRTGVTGARAELAAGLAGLVGRIRAISSRPVAVGFGISTPEQVAEVCRIADAAVVGSAIVQMIARQAGQPGLPESVEKFVRALKEATRGRGRAPAR